jgi:peptidyl-prolyl cis-trans isomerase B (cyclophilin B)
MKTSTLLVLVLIVIVVGYFMVTDNKGSDSTDANGDSATSGVISAVIKTNKGDIELELYKDIAPKTVENFTKLSTDGFYDGIKFHRVISEFMIQSGDPQSKELDLDDPLIGTGGPGYMVIDEINPDALELSSELVAAMTEAGYTFNYELESIPVDVGTIAMANTNHPNTNGSQFFIVTEQDQPHLNGLHTVFGKVTKGMDVVTSIERGDEIETIVIEETSSDEN